MAKLCDLRRFLDTLEEEVAPENLEVERENCRSNTNLENQPRFELRATAKQRRKNSQNHVEIEKAAHAALNEYTSDNLQVCSHCFAGNDDGNSNDVIEWQSCEHCNLWFHTLCIPEMMYVHPAPRFNAEILICTTCVAAENDKSKRPAPTDRSPNDNSKRSKK